MNKPKTFQAKPGHEDISFDDTTISSDATQNRLTRFQRTTLNAFRSYCAYNAGISDEMVDDLFCMVFGIKESADLSPALYDAAVEWYTNFDFSRLIQ